jgi:hypothetical protein
MIAINSTDQSLPINGVEVGAAIECSSSLPALSFCPALLLAVGASDLQGHRYPHMEGYLHNFHASFLRVIFMTTYILMLS